MATSHAVCSTLEPDMVPLCPRSGLALVKVVTTLYSGAGIKAP